MASIPIEDLDEKTRNKMGIALPPSLGEVGRNLVALGKVFNAIKGLSEDEALQVLLKAQMYMITKKTTPSIEVVGLSHDELLDDYVPPIEWTLEVTAKIYGLKPSDLKQRKRDASIAEARQVAMYVLYMTNGYSLNNIGQGIGGRSPATVSYAFNHISIKMREDPELKQTVSEIQQLITGK